MGLSRTAYEIDGDFGRKSSIFRTPYTYAHTLWVPLDIGYRRKGPKKLELWDNQTVKTF